MAEHALLLPVLLIFLTFIPAYADVTSLQTDRSLYSVDMGIYFTGTVDGADSQKLVNLMIQDPNGKIILMTGKNADSNNQFQIVVNTNDPSQFYLKGTYSASAFVVSKQDGKTIYFDFSPDGSPVYHASEPTNISASHPGPANPSKQVTTSNLTGFRPSEIVKVGDTVTISKNAAMPNAYIVTKSSFQSENILYIIMALCGSGLVGFIIYSRKKKLTGNSGQSGERPSLKADSHQDYAMMILKNRLAKGELTLDEFKMIRDALNEP